jgi:DNA-binding GntR family transcriptional regulator
MIYGLWNKPMGQSRRETCKPDEGDQLVSPGIATQRRGVANAADRPIGATDHAEVQILNALERHQIVPGQRLVETELAIQLGVGRNAVREAIQRLAAKGIVDLSRNRSPSIRKLDMTETMEVLEVAEEMFGLLARIAARNLECSSKAPRLSRVLHGFSGSERGHDPVGFSAKRREFYRCLLEIGANRELHRHFATLQMPTIYLQFESRELYQVRIADYCVIGQAVLAGDTRKAEMHARRHVRRVRRIIRAMSPGLLERQ